MDPQVQQLKQKVLSATLPDELRQRVLGQLERLSYALQSGGAGSYGYFEQTSKYIDWITALPWHNRSKDMLDVPRAKRILDTDHYGLDKVKRRMLEYLSVIVLQRKKQQEKPHINGGKNFTLLNNIAPENSVIHAPILCFVGLVGTGKTTMALSIAKALNRKVIRVPFGGLASALDLRGLSRVHPEAEPGVIIRALRRVNVKNPVILLDELDRVSDEKRQEIMGVLVELLDPAQNQTFVDHYIEFPFDLSEAIFVATANNINTVATAVVDRMEVIQMPSYTDDEKLHIGRDYLLPSVLKEAGLSKDNVRIEDKLWPVLIRPLGFDSGTRTLKRTLQSVARHVAWKMLNGEGDKFVINESNYREFISG